MLEVPQLRRIAGLQARIEQVGPCRPVGEEIGTGGQEARESVGHEMKART
jgi:hypothetical protein